MTTIKKTDSNLHQASFSAICLVFKLIPTTALFPSSVYYSVSLSIVASVYKLTVLLWKLKWLKQLLHASTINRP